MLFSDMVYVGLDPTAGKRPMHYAALDNQLRLVALDSGNMEDVLAFVAGQEKAVVAVDAPQSPNQELMLRSDIRRSFDLDPDGRTWGQWKVCEYELRRRNIRLYNTPNIVEEAKGWVRMGFQLYQRMAQLGYRHFHAGESMTATASTGAGVVRAIFAKTVRVIGYSFLLRAESCSHTPRLQSQRPIRSCLPLSILQQMLCDCPGHGTVRDDLTDGTSFGTDLAF